MINIQKIIPGGMGLGTLDDGKKIFFWNALPGEIVESYDVVKNKPHYEEAIATSIHHASKYRVTPQDACFLATSPWQIMNYHYELEQKSELVTEIFREHQIMIDPPMVATDYHDYAYRNKMEYALYWDHDEERIKLALHQRGSHRKVLVETSSIERPEILAAANQIIDDLNQKHAEARWYQSLLLRCSQDGQVSGGLLPNHAPHPRFPNLKDQILGRTYSYSPNGFFQINLPVYEMALLEIKNHLMDYPVLDLYSGVGTIGLSVASNHHLTLVESNPAAFEELKRNCSLSDPADFPSPPRAIHEKSENVTDYIAPDQTVILDPPRAGCDTKLINQILTTMPRQVIYLSCNPATQARDIKPLLAKYHLNMVKAFNFFPRTPHIENLIVLSL